jgi:hypothetical protein
MLVLTLLLLAWRSCAASAAVGRDVVGMDGRVALA